MTWLLVAFVPGLLMLATFGLERLETGLYRDTVTATDVAAFLEQAEADDMSTLVRDGMPEALACLHRRRAAPIDDSREHQLGSPGLYADPFAASPLHEPGSPTRRYRHTPANPQFQPPRHANRV